MGGTVPIWRILDFLVVAVEENQYFVIASQKQRDSMALGLYPIASNSTRLIWRIHLGSYSGTSRWVVAQFFTDLADFIAVRQNLRGIKARAEGRAPESTKHVYAELLLWVVCFMAFVAAEIAVLLKKSLGRPLAAAAATGLLTTWLVLVQPPFWLTAIGTIVAWMLVWWMAGPRNRAVPAVVLPANG